MNGPIYILDKKTKALTTYLDFNGRDERPGLFDRLLYEPGYSSGVSQLQFDPDYRRNGKFYTVHMESPTLPGSQRPDTTERAGPHVRPVRLRADRSHRDAGPDSVRIDPDRVDRYEHSKRDVRGHRTRGDARAAERTHPPDGRDGVSSDGAARRSRMARDVHRSRRQRRGRDRARSHPHESAAARYGASERSSASFPDPGAGPTRRARSTLSENGRYRIPNDNPFASTPGREEGNLGVRPSQPASIELGCRSVRTRAAIT